MERVLAINFEVLSVQTANDSYIFIALRFATRPIKMFLMLNILLTMIGTCITSGIKKCASEKETTTRDPCRMGSVSLFLYVRCGRHDKAARCFTKCVSMTPSLGTPSWPPHRCRRACARCCSQTGIWTEDQKGKKDKKFREQFTKKVCRVRKLTAAE
jgi:hypothetical protein